MVKCMESTNGSVRLKHSVPMLAIIYHLSITFMLNVVHVELTMGNNP